MTKDIMTKKNTLQTFSVLAGSIAMLTLVSCVLLEEKTGKGEEPTPVSQIETPAGENPAPPMPEISEEQMFSIASEKTPLDRVVNAFAEPLETNTNADGGMFDSTQDPNAQKITNYEVLPLPNGFLPDGIAISKDGTIYVASIKSGTIVKGKADGLEITDILVDLNQQGGAWGIDLTENDKYLWVAGGLAGTSRSYDAETGELVAEVVLANFGVVNDLIVTGDAVYLTNTGFPLLYKIPLDAEGKQSGEPSVIKLSSKTISDPQALPSFNGIEYDASKNILIGNNPGQGTNHAINPQTGEVMQIDLQGEITSNDGIVLDGNMLYGVESPKNQVASFKLSDDLKSAKLTKRFTADIFDFPTLIASDGEYFYVVNGKLSTKKY